MYSNVRFPSVLVCHPTYLPVIVLGSLLIRQKGKLFLIKRKYENDTLSFSSLIHDTWLL